MTESATLSVLRVDGRIAAVRDALVGQGVDSLLVSNLTNIRWLTGFSGSNGWVIITQDGATLVTDGRYGGQAARQLASAGAECSVVIGYSGPELENHVVAALDAGWLRGFEAAHVSVQQHAKWSERVEAMVPLSGVVEHARRLKTPAEIERIGSAAGIADRALAEVATLLQPGRTEVEVRNRLETLMREFGADGPSYETIVAAGPVNAALPHHRPTSTPLEAGHTVIIDVGALVDGYHSDMTRSFVVGEPTSLQRELYELVLAAQTAGVAAVRPGLATAELDAVCRSIIADAGYGDWFSHGTGHGVGLLIHEDPFINSTGGYTLQEGDVVTVEPGLYRDGFGGFRVEDLVVVTGDGCRVLTASPKDSPCLPSPPMT
jgi:Xaa-Pro aminopeptidase